jgi:hypothetical protein
MNITGQNSRNMVATDFRGPEHIGMAHRYVLKNRFVVKSGEFDATIRLPAKSELSLTELNGMTRLVEWLQQNEAQLYAVLRADALWARGVWGVDNPYFLEIIPEEPTTEYLLGDAWSRQLIISWFHYHHATLLPEAQTRIFVGTDYNQEDGCEMIVRDGKIISINERLVEWLDEGIVFVDDYTGECYALIPFT